MATTKTSCSSAILAAKTYGADLALIAARFSQALLHEILRANVNLYPKYNRTLERH